MGGESPTGADVGTDSETMQTDVDPDTPLLLDAMLGKLSTYLRMCGYDAVYALDEGIEADDPLLERARADGRLLLTRDRDLATRAGDAGVLLTERDVADQLRELHAAGFRLELDDRPARCGSCNGPVDVVGEEDGRPDHAPPECTLYRCRSCGQHFWKGSHWDDVADRLAAVKER